MTFRYHHNFQNGLFGKYAKTIERIPLPGCSILEIGCSTGFFGQELLSRGYNVLGIEADEDAAKIAQGNGLKVIVADIENTTLWHDSNKRFDVILLMDILEHLKEPAMVLNKIKLILNKEGTVIVTGPNVAFWYIRLQLAIGRWDYQETGILDQTHLRFYTYRGWQRLLQSSGYRIIYWEAVDGMLPFASKLEQAGVSKRFLNWLLKKALQWMPELFATQYFFVLTPE